MWYQAIPAAASIAVFMIIPDVTMPLLNKLVFGHKYLRSNVNTEDYGILTRTIDQFGTGDGFHNYKGLESLPDEPPEKYRTAS